jgi:hypothetical protein
MASTYDLISSQTLSSATATVTFSSILSTYTDLRLITTVTATTGGNDLYVRLNADSSASYSSTYLTGNGTTATSFYSSGGIYGTSIDPCYLVGLSSTIPQFFDFNIFNYAGSTYKTVLAIASQDQNGSGLIGNQVTLYRSTTAISSITISAISDTFKIGSTFNLYGIKAA